MKKSTRYIAIWILVWLLPIVVFSQETNEKLAKLSTDYKKYGLADTNIPEKWEDGSRTDGEKGSYEWWYFDAHLDDGSTAVIIFYTKLFINVDKPLTPFITINIDKPDGTKILKALNFDKATFSSSKDSCNVQIGKNYFRGNLKTYEIHFEDEELDFTATLHRTTESWRPQTGHIVFGENEERYFAWVVSVPQGKTEVTFTYKGEKTTSKGSAYHDHNWGNVNMMELFNHWYWSRAEIGPYNVIASEMISEKEFGKENIIVFNLSKDGKTIADNGNEVTLYRTYGKIHPRLGKDVSDDLVFIYDNPEDDYRYEYYLYRQQSLVEVDLMKVALGDGFKYKLAKLVTSIEPAYFRFTGTAKIKVFKNNVLVEEYSSPTAVWELMYFGKPNE